jgi:hypothetical protein
MECEDRQEWLKSMKVEVKTLIDKDVYTFVDELPPNRRLVGTRFVYKRKRDKAGKVYKHKSRLVAQGFSQVPGIDFFETYAPTPRWDTIRFTLAIATQLGLTIITVDVDAAYVAATLKEEIYAKIPRGYPFKVNGKYMKLKKCLYGLKQAGREWSQLLRTSLRNIGFNECEADPCMFIKITSGAPVFLLFYVDDIIICGEQEQALKTKMQIAKLFTIKDGGQLSWFLSCGVDYDQKQGTLFLSQTAFAKTLLERAGMINCKPISAPLAERLTTPDQPPDKEEQEQLDADNVTKQHPKLVGALLYLSTCTRPDLAFSVYQLTRFMSAPRLIHWKALKRVLRYLKGTCDFGLMYQRNDKTDFMLVGFSDADWAGDPATRKSTTGYVFMICGGAISWKATGQGTVALSTAEAELVALTATIKHAVWLARLAQNFGFNFKPMTIMEDNQATIAIVNSDNKFSERTKHIGVKYFYARDQVINNEVVVKYVETDDQFADIFTKPLVGVLFCRHRGNLGLRRKD